MEKATGNLYEMLVKNFDDVWLNVGAYAVGDIMLGGYQLWEGGSISRQDLSTHFEFLGFI